MSNIDKRALREELSNAAIGSNAHLRKLALALLEELEAKEDQRANWFQMAQKLGDDLDAAEKRIAELEKSHAQVIQGRDHYKRMCDEGFRRINKGINLSINGEG
ncbi:ead/Ea22-like family protein [Enterobacter hormaechei]|uniref:ead/Ea22-like family protein n=1 Tax=Enterobacter hormaechei TaxID=158836 RepID=UPI0022F12D1F|nr:ead/Ea22-like family protein [Enterobacter hormaechei]ELE6460855.1 hypothetical protein [Enterobacter hormaechei]MDA4780713.1 hypothetical protein [Enterobacter hormaechei]